MCLSFVSGVDLVSSLTSADEASQSGARNSNAPWRPQFQILVKNADGTVTLQPCPETLRHVVSASGAAPEQPKKRRPGRPRKGMERLLPPEKKKEEKPKEPITGGVVFMFLSIHEGRASASVMVTVREQRFLAWQWKHLSAGFGILCKDFTPADKFAQG